MHRIRPAHALAAIAAAAALVVAGCSGTPSDEVSGEASTTVTSAYGDVAVPAHPERVAAVSYDTPWQLMSLDVQPVATIDYSRWADSYTSEQLAFIADAATIGTYGEVDYEALAKADPDLIIGDAGEVDETAYQRLSEIAPTVIVSGGARGDWQTITEQVADAVGAHDSWAASKAAYEQRRDEVKAQYADVIAANRWINFSLGDDASQFSVQLPTGSTGNLVVNEMGLEYGANVPLDDADGSGYASFSLEQLGTVFDGVTVALTFADGDGAMNASVQKIVDTDVFQALDVARSGHVYPLETSVTDYRTATDWIDELVSKVLTPLAS